MEMELEERGDQEPLPPGGNAPPPLAPPPPRSGEVPGVEEEVPGVVMPEVVAGVVAGEAGVVVAKVAGVGARVVPGELPERLGEGKEGSSRGAPPPQPQFPTPPQPREPRGENQAAAGAADAAAEERKLSGEDCQDEAGKVEGQQGSQAGGRRSADNLAGQEGEGEANIEHQVGDGDEAGLP